MIYSISGTGVLFHEITGIAIFTLFSVHLFYNRKWISSISKNVLDKTVNKKTKFMYIIDILLFGSFWTARKYDFTYNKKIYSFSEFYWKNNIRNHINSCVWNWFL
ncbi:MAG: hypothetical protein LBJ41_12190 [Treponema sp.]|nr:hypothetical protein [Treponema sp.]